MESASDIVNYDKFSFSSNHISSDSKTKDKNTYQNGLRSKLKREFYLQKFINNKPLHTKKKEKIPKNISLQSIRPVIKKNDCKNKNDFRLINNRQKQNSGRSINTENNKQIKKLKYKFSGKVIMKKWVSTGIFNLTNIYLFY